MTYEEAIKQLDRVIEHYKVIHIIDVQEIKALEVAKTALEKQIPKKPKKLAYKLLIDDGWIYECPTCGCACGENKYHPDVTKDEIYCTQCGQMLDFFLGE